MPTTTWEEYWGPIREQFLSAQQHRNHIVSCPLENSGWIPFLDAYFTSPTGYGMRWIGVSRFQVQDVSPAPLPLTNASAGAWAVSSGCTLSFGTSSITVTPSAAQCVFYLNLQQFGAQPYMFPAICNEIGLNWSSTNIASIDVYGISNDGLSSDLLANAPGTVDLAAYPDFDYAGSWGFDNGFGVVTDGGFDVHPMGISSYICGNNAAQMAFGLLANTQPAYLEFVVTPSNPANPFSIDYPTFTPNTAKILIHENGQISNHLYENGPAVRWGNHVWWDPILGFVDPPEYSPLGYKGSVLDWLCDKRIVLYGVDALTGLVAGNSLAAECAILYDSFEGNSVGQVSYNSNYFLLPPAPSSPQEATARVALVNSWSEVPPLAGFPAFGYNDDWSRNTNLVQQTCALCQLPRRFSNPSGPMDLLSPSGAKLTSPSAAPYIIAGQNVTEATPVVTNAETPDFLLVTQYGTSGQETWAEVTDWHGYFANVPCPPLPPTGVSAVPGTASVTISWTASAGAVSYNIYQGTTSGGPYTLAASGITGTSRTISGLTSGTTYYFVVTAYGTGGMSIYSSQVSAVPT